MEDMGIASYAEGKTYVGGKIGQLMSAFQNADASIFKWYIK